MQKIDVIKIYQRKTALVIDDYPDMRGSVRRMLVNFGVDQVDTAANGEEAIKLCEDHHYDIILADYNLGESKSGQQILEELRYQDLLRRTSVYMMITAETTSSMVFGALEYQPDEYLTKPFTQAVLQKRLDRLVIEKEVLKDVLQAMDERDWGVAAARCHRHLSNKTKYETRCLRLLAECLYRHGDYEAATRVYQQVLKRRALEWAEIGLGKSLIAMGQTADAAALFRDLAERKCKCLEVYDCLADIENQNGRYEEAQRLLEHASSISPNAILRQQKLARISEENGDLEGAEHAYRKIVRLAAHSCYEEPESYFNLARTIGSQLSKLEKPDSQKLKDVDNVLAKAKRRYRDDKGVQLRTDVVKSQVLMDAGKTEEASKLIGEVKRGIDSGAITDPEVTLELARAYQAGGDRSKANQLLRDLAEKHSDNEALCDAIDQMADEPISAKGKKQAVTLNQQGKDLFASKDFEGAMRLFGEALRHYPNNVALNLNLLLALVRRMESDGADSQMLMRCDALINQVGELPADHQLADRFKTLCKHVDGLRRQLTSKED